MKQTAEFLGARRQLPVTDTADRGRVVGHDGHRELRPRAVPASLDVGHRSRKTREAGDPAHDRRRQRPSDRGVPTAQPRRQKINADDPGEERRCPVNEESEGDEDAVRPEA